MEELIAPSIADLTASPKVVQEYIIALEAALNEAVETNKKNTDAIMRLKTLLEEVLGDIEKAT